MLGDISLYWNFVKAVTRLVRVEVDESHDWVVFVAPLFCALHLAPRPFSSLLRGRTCPDIYPRRTPFCGASSGELAATSDLELGGRRRGRAVGRGD
jgi:hypothetical protein